MTIGFAHIVILGRLGQDPADRSGEFGSRAVLNVAVGGRPRSSTSKVPERETSWHRVVAFGPTAEFAMRHIRKGDLVLVSGIPEQRRFQDKSGKPKEVWEITAIKIELAMTGRKPADSDAGRESDSRPSTGSAPASEPMFDDIPY